MLFSYNVSEDNEGYSMLLCGTKLVHIVHELHRVYKTTPPATKRYQLTIFSTILSNTEDHKKDKKSDYVIYKLKNKQCIEVQKKGHGMPSHEVEL